MHYGVGIEDTFIPHEGVGRRKLDEYELTQHYHYWRRDLELAAESGATLIRWGIPWYLTEPAQGVFDFRWVDEVAATMDELGLRCVVDLMHYGTPRWLENSFLHPDYPRRVAAYGAEVATRYVGVFDDFTPMNEPIVNAIWCGRDGRWPPYLTGTGGFVRVMIQLALGMVTTQRAIAAAHPAASIVHVDAGFRWVGESFPGLSHELLNEWRFLPLDLITGRVRTGHPMRSYLLENGAPEGDLDWLTANPVVPDVVGVNYYPGFSTLRFDPDTGAEVPVEAGTEGLRDLLQLYAARYGRPLAVTETSRPTADSGEKIEWIDELISSIVDMRQEGLPIAGAFWFPMLDLFDWSYRDESGPADDYLKRFGLIDLVRGPDNVLARVPNAAFEHFKRRMRS